MISFDTLHGGHMIVDCETCDRKQVPCSSCQTSQRAICFICQGDVADPYGELVCDARTETAIGLWHKFANASHIEWANETHKAEYLAAVDGITSGQLFRLLLSRIDFDGQAATQLTGAITLLRDGLSGMAPDERMRWKVRVETFLASQVRRAA